MARPRIGKRAHASFTKALRTWISNQGQAYSQEKLRKDVAYILGESYIHKNTISNFEASKHRSRDDTIKAIAAALTHKIRQLCEDQDLKALLDPIEFPLIAHIFDRLMLGQEPLLDHSDFVLNDDKRFCVSRYDIKLTVWPCGDRVAQIHRGSTPDPEAYQFDNIAHVLSRVEFARDNLRSGPGFKLRYSTYKGRLVLLAPDERLIDQGFRVHRNALTYDASPDDLPHHGLELLVLGGYGPGYENAHFSLTQPAVYEDVSLTLDLRGFPPGSLAEGPELMLIPVLKSLDLDCCELARSRQGRPIEPSAMRDGEWRWDISGGYTNLLIGIHWKVDWDRLRLSSLAPDSTRDRYLSLAQAEVQRER